MCLSGDPGNFLGVIPQGPPLHVYNIKIIIMIIIIIQ